MNMQFGGLLGLLIFAADVWAIINIFQSGAASEKRRSGSCWSPCCRCWG